MFRDLESAIAALKPSILVGVAAQPGAFTPRVLRHMAQNHKHPFIFPLSNPTSLAECTAAAAFEATGGACVFASGSPFPPVVLVPGGRKVRGGSEGFVQGCQLGELLLLSLCVATAFVRASLLLQLISQFRPTLLLTQALLCAHTSSSSSYSQTPNTQPSQVYPAQANNAYIFPAIGHAALLTRCSTIPHSVFLKAAAALAELATPEQLQQGQLFPPFSEIRKVEVHLTAVLARFMVQQGLGQLPAGFNNPSAAAAAGQGLGGGRGSSGGGLSPSVQQHEQGEEQGLGVWQEFVQQRMFSPLQQQQQKRGGGTMVAAAGGGGGKGGMKQQQGEKEKVVVGSSGSSRRLVVSKL